MLESRMVTSARPNPLSMALRSVLPVRISSLNRSKISTLASTAIPMDRMMPAMPGRVSVAFRYRITSNSSMVYSSSAMSATTPLRR